MPRALLLLPTSTYRASEFLAAAARLGVEVVTGSDAPQALAGVMGDHFLELDLDDPERAASAIATFARRVPLEAVVAVDDRGARAAALASERLGLLHNSPEAVAATRDKATMRKMLGEAGVAQPSWQIVPASPADPEGEADRVAAAARTLGFPVVVKPCTLSGSRGVVRADDDASVRVVARRVRSIVATAGEAADAPLIVERFVPGPEVAVEGIVRSGSFTSLAVFDKPDPLDGPYFEETIYVTPSRLDASDCSAAADLVAAAVRALGLTEGPVHAELRLPHLAAASASRALDGSRTDAALDPPGPVVVEVAARTIGGKCSRALRFAQGTSLETLVLGHALGLDAGHGPLPVLEPGASGVMMLPIPRSGTLEEVAGVDDALAVAHVTGVEIAIARGRPVEALPEGGRYLGFVFARADTPDEVELALRRAHRELEVRIA